MQGMSIAGTQASIDSGATRVCPDQLVDVAHLHKHVDQVLQAACARLIQPRVLLLPPLL
jgi:hypothetical protein